MPAMLPVPADGAPRLTAVLGAALASVAAGPNPLGLPSATSAVVVLVDGLGAANLAARSGHARALAGRMSKRDVIRTVFPSTTAAAIASFATGLMPGVHGLMGYRVPDRRHDRVVNQLSGWDDRMVPEEWQRHETVFDQALERGIRAVAVGGTRYATSGFTRAVLRGAEYRAGATIADRFAEAARVVQEGPALVYVYVSELDQIAHAHGWESDRWISALESLDAEVAAFERRMPRGVGLLVTADHGMVDVPAHRHVFVDARPDLLEGIRHVAGEPRCLGLVFEPDLPATDRAALLDGWREAEGARAWVLSGDEAVAAGLYGDVDPANRDRIADILISARAGVAYYDRREADRRGESMVGQHGSMTDDETRIPLIRAGVFTRS
ncbi:alkaline phosphatase family protein [Agromyces indicus]|uniref:Alkaline phosphatase family protein n=1 Tax=Agromyces indicus TaxID=758919 RepID=A0ABU1FQF2_9MICO|nr:alkaline phosphatase family protein [Agromyces indicus]MDR5693547.1 alkaline phosphatase family protein [Agromyces indicus]